MSFLAYMKQSREHSEKNRALYSRNSTSCHIPFKLKIIKLKKLAFKTHIATKLQERGQ